MQGERRWCRRGRLPVHGCGAGQPGGEIQVHHGLPGEVLAEEQPRQADAERPRGK
jgi:hypothetical protein